MPFRPWVKRVGLRPANSQGLTAHVGLKSKNTANLIKAVALDKSLPGATQVLAFWARIFYARSSPSFLPSMRHSPSPVKLYSNLEVPTRLWLQTTGAPLTCSEPDFVVQQPLGYPGYDGLCQQHVAAPFACAGIQGTSFSGQVPEKQPP